MKQPRKVRPVRMSDEEVEAANKKGEAWGLHDFSSTVRFALNKLKVPK